MYCSSGDHEVFARPKKPADVDNKHACIIGTGLTALSTACYLVRGGQMPGENIHVLKKDPIPGGVCDGLDIPSLGYMMHDGREMDNYFEAMWDLFRSTPSIETEGVSVLDEYYWLNKKDPNYSLCRATKNLGKDAGLKDKFRLSDKASMEIMKLFFTPDEDLYGKPVTGFFDDEVLNSNFWLCRHAMFAFENWHSALEMKLYIKRYIHHIGGLPDFSALRFTRYSQYESVILPVIKYLESHGVEFRYDTKVEDMEFAIGGGAGPKREHTGVGQDTIRKIRATSGFFKCNPVNTPTKELTVRIDVDHGGDKSLIDLVENDLAFITNGGRVENSIMGSQDSPAVWDPDLEPGGGWDMWKRIADQDPSFDHPEKFCSDSNATKWMSAIVTTLDGEISPYIQKIRKRDPSSGKVVTGGIVAVQDFNWLMSWALNRQQQFRNQPKDQLCVRVYGLFPDRPGNYVKKPMTEHTGEEICEEWLYHMGVPTDKIETLAKHHANTVPVMMPYITAFFMPRTAGDCPDVVPDGAVNFALLDQFAETPHDTIFTTKYSMHTDMGAVYTLLGADRGAPEAWGSVYDVRSLLNATVKLRDGAPVIDMKLSFIKKAVVKKMLKKLDGTDVATLLREYRII